MNGPLDFKSFSRLRLRLFGRGPLRALHNNLRERLRARKVVLPSSTSLDGKVRLNLGCGDKLLEGYLNIDIAPSRKGKIPDYLCDLRALTLPDDYADEILSVHVIEHFYFWEATEVLREWIRVLKPGGKMIIECPNLQAAAEALLADPETRCLDTREGQSTMWVFYGDPAWKDPLMVHRWGYTPESLKRLLASLGLERVGQEPARFKMREPRDMRVTGIKPRKTGDA